MMFLEGIQRQKALARLKPFRKRMEVIISQHLYPAPDLGIQVVNNEVRVVKRERK